MHPTGVFGTDVAAQAQAQAQERETYIKGTAYAQQNAAQGATGAPRPSVFGAFLEDLDKKIQSAAVLSERLTRLNGALFGHPKSVGTESGPKPVPAGAIGTVAEKLQALDSFLAIANGALTEIERLV